ncbi:alanine--glyoxylate aminotransferase family protein [Ornithinibacillus gellani]|uniref:pyridoxal-phosphate-dependent aminotransferase family protein n=1 Tax=Ornithinibacillus gellani TaxID=2293253 RepID=UPI000F4AA485|nr:alanine--glyoxylate aminotransferase family protein [Ornithinibacillus gellani]TQS76541.1 alanine--glyoxylate aminotransferase family protein [Ornithinibacillus gellani]
MHTDHQILRIPGPTPIPPSIQLAMSQPIIGHRDSLTKELLERIQPLLKPVFGTKEKVTILASSGTGGLEAAVSNTLNSGDEVLVVVTGAFGERFSVICESYDIQVHTLEIEWGKAADPTEIERMLKQHPNIRAVFLTYCETSTGVLNPIEKLAEAIQTHSDALIIVDGVSCIGAVHMEMDAWGIDVVVSGSQKAFMLPPGLAFIAMSKRASAISHSKKHHGLYFDLNKYEAAAESSSTPFTPAVSLLFGLEQALHLMHEEGFASTVKRHNKMMQMTRAAFRAMDIPLLTTDSDASPTVTAIAPIDFNAEALRTALKKEFQLIIAGGQKQLKGKIFRIGHMGFCSPADVFQYISLVEICLHHIRSNHILGAGTTAAQKVFVQPN